jgi:hypothetical protein
MTQAPLPTPTYPAPNRHSDGSINIDAYRAIATVERQKALHQFRTLVARTLKPGDGRPMVRGYTARLG